jgi:hypothetical protein
VSAAPIVYLGPSLPRAEADRMLAADYRPPVRRGDLPAQHDGIVLIIDGEFDQSFSVSPQEIVRLLEHGARVLGASSMGALRAAELYTYGMEGLGWIFEAYQSGRIEGDDEVALTYSPFDYRPLTVPLVNVRYWLERLAAEGTLDRPLARRLIAKARKVFYAERTVARLRDAWTQVVDPATVEGLLVALRETAADVKAADTRLALAHLANLVLNGTSCTKETGDGERCERVG